jgi:hypothetical protein
VSDHDDEHDDRENDPVMRSMRSVWLSMREEDPPEAGISALLAAAREKAESMQASKVPWWQRVFAVLRRPPVLAIATVVVLVGGAVLVANRRDAVEVAPVVEPTPLPPPPEIIAPDAPGVVAQSKESNAENKPDTTIPDVKVPEEQLQTRADIPHRDPPPPVRRVTKPPIVVKPPMVAPSTEKPPVTANSGLDYSESTTAGTTAAPPAQDPRPAPEPKPKLEIAQEDDRTVAPGRAPSTVPDKTKQTGEANGEDAEREGGKHEREREPSIDQLVNQCISAASRGDCAAVRATASRVKKADPGAFRARLERQPTIARCLK